MKYGDEYMHYKGNRYRFLGIALPLKGATMSKETVDNMSFVTHGRYHEDTHDIKIYSIDSAFFVDSDIPYVVYQSEHDYCTEHFWLREVDDYFGYVQINNKFLKRFTLIQP